MNEIQQTTSWLDFSDMGEDAGYLRDKAVEYASIELKSRFEKGRILEEIAQKYANHNGGQYCRFCEQLKISTSTADRDRKFYRYVFPIWENAADAPDLLNGQFDALASGKANPQLAEAVKNGEVKNSKEYKEMEKRLAYSEQAREQAERENATLTEQYNAQAKELQDLRENPTVVETPADPRLEAELAEEKQKRSEEKQKRIEAEQQIAWLKQNPPEPKDYRANKRRIEELERDVATYKAHEEGLTLQQKAMIDAEVAKYKNTASEEIHKSMRIMDLIAAVRNLPKNMEVADYAESHIRQEVGGEAHARADIEKMVIDMKVICEELDKYLHKERKLQVVK